MDKLVQKSLTFAVQQQATPVLVLCTIAVVACVHACPLATERICVARLYPTLLPVMNHLVNERKSKSISPTLMFMISHPVLALFDFFFFSCTNNRLISAKSLPVIIHQKR